MKGLLERESRTQKLLRRGSFAVCVLIVLIVVLSLSAALLPASAESETETTAVSETETTAVNETETTAVSGNESETDWSQVDVEIKQNDNFFTVILRGIGTFLNWITRYITGRNYIVALFVFAVLIELILIPFGIKQHKNSIKQARLRPKEAAIRKKYAGQNDQATRQKMQQEIQALYQSENFNPLSGCLPLLLQLPIILMLYYIVIDPFKYGLGLSDAMKNVIVDYMKQTKGIELASSRGTIELLTQMKAIGIEGFEGLKTFAHNGQECFEALQAAFDSIPSFSLFGLNCGYVITDANASWALRILVPTLTFGAQFGSMKLNRKLTYQPSMTGDEKSQGCSNNVMDIVMPLFSVYISFIVPAAVAVYWIFKSITTVLKQVILVKIMPYPTFTEEDYKAAEREILGKNPKRKKTGNGGSGAVSASGKRSLHHIDDDEYEDTAPVAPARRKEPYTEEDEPAPELPEENGKIGLAPLKDDTPDRKRKKQGREKDVQEEPSENENGQPDDLDDETPDTEPTDEQEANSEGEVETDSEQDEHKESDN